MFSLRRHDSRYTPIGAVNSANNSAVQLATPRISFDVRVPSPSPSESQIAPKSDHQVKVVCVGDGGCGKTCLLVTYAHGHFPMKYAPTVFENYHTTLRTAANKLVDIALWDTAGQEEYDRLRALAYPGVNVLLVCFSIASPVSLKNIFDKWLPEISLHCPNVPYFLVGLKSDVRDDADELHRPEPVSFADGAQAALLAGAAEYLECSARAHTGVDHVFDRAIAASIGHRQYYGSARPRRRKKRLFKPLNMLFEDKPARPPQLRTPHSTWSRVSVDRPARPAE